MKNDDKVLNNLTDSEKIQINKDLEELDKFLKKKDDLSEKDLDKKISEVNDNIITKLDKAEAKSKIDKISQKIKERTKDENDPLSRLSDKDKRKIKGFCEDTLINMDELPENATKNDVDLQRKDLESKLNPIIERANKLKESEDYARDIKRRANDYHH